MPYNKRKLSEVMDLGFTPWCGDFVKKENIGTEETYPLSLGFDLETSLLQLNYFVPKEKMFSNHTYMSGTTETLKKHFKEVAKWVSTTEKIKPTHIILDIGSNDGSQLKEWVNLGFKNVIGVESSKNIAKIALNSGIKTIPKFFNESLLGEDLKDYIGKVSVINASGIFFHLEELDSVTHAVKKLLTPKGVFVIQFMYALDMFKNNTFDMIYHEHLYYYTLHSLNKYLLNFGLNIYDGYHSDIHSGSMIVKVCHLGEKPVTDKITKLKKNEIRTLGSTHKKELNSWVNFAENILRKRSDLKKLLITLNKQGKKVYGMGAPAKSCTLFHYYGITNKMISNIFEVNPMKIGLYTPGTHIPIVKEDPSDTPDYFVLLAHNFEEEIVKKFPKTKFIIPFPEVRIVP